MIGPLLDEPGFLRPAQPGDVPAILALITEHAEQLLPRRRADVEALIETFWVMEERGDVVGCCCLEVYSPKIAEVRSLAVRATARGRGYGARLVSAAVAEAKRRGIPQVLVVTSNVEFFSRQHFKPCLNEKYALFWEGPEDGGAAVTPNSPAPPDAELGIL
jgi:N-acetylglutamate synthase-like GNAT family acetyltransferase